MSPAGDFSGAENSLVELIRHSADGLEQVIKLLQGFILGIARTVDPAGAEDCAQEAQLLLLTRIRQFRGTTDAELRGWIRVIVCNLCFARLKRIKSESPLGNADDAIASDRSPSQEVRAEEERRKIVSLLETLSEDERTAVLLRHCENWSIDEIAAELSRTPAAIGGLLRRAMEKLRSRSTISQWSQLLNRS